MSLSSMKILADEMHAKTEQIRREQGEAAAKEHECSTMGAGLGMLSGSLKGAAIGSIVPGIGTAIGAFVGGMYGIVSGMNDKSRTDNIKTVIGLGKTVSKM